MITSAVLKSIVSNKTITLSANQTIATALETMSLHAISSIIILNEEKRPTGIFTEHDALRIISTQISTKDCIETVMSKNPFSVSESMLVHDAYLLMEEKKFRHLIVVDEYDAFVGVVTEGDFLRQLGFENLSNFKLVNEVMSQSPLLIDHTNTLTKAVTLMQEHDADYAIVLKENFPIGIITERDIVHYYSSISEETADTVEQVLQSDITMIDKSTSLQEATQLMEEHGTHQLIVLDENKKLIGLLTRHDILHAIHGAYFEFLIDVIDKKGDTIDEVNARNIEILKQQKLAEKSEQKYKALFELIPYGVYMIDFESKLPVEFNSISHNQIGYNEEEFKQLRISDYEAIENEEEHLKHLEHLKENGHDIFETKFRCKDGSLIDIEVNVLFVHILDKPFLMTVTREITQQKKAALDEKYRNKEFEKQSRFLHTILNTIPDLIWLKDMEGKYLACNKKFEKFYNAKESDMLGKTDFEFVDEKLAKFFRENDLASIKAGGSRTNDEYLNFADGSYSGYFETVKTPMRDKNGNDTGVLGIAHDVSERKRKNIELSKVQALAHIGTWEWDVPANIFVGSSEVHRIFNIPINTNLSMQNILEIVHEDDREFQKNILYRALEEKKFPEMINRLKTSDGKVKWIKTNSEFILDNENNILKAVGITQDITEHIEYEQRLESLANFDTLTGLANRKQLLRHLDTKIEHSKRYKKTLALLMFDLDRFKDVNDSYGHSAGDELLKLVADRFSLRLREGDFLARLGGDEFAIIMNNFSHLEDAGILADEIIELLVKEYKLSCGALVHIGASAGISLYPNHSENTESLLQHVDAALYKAKAGGRGIYSYYTDELTSSARARVDYATRLRRAIVQKEFELYYQPQVHIATGRIIGAEALIRWNEPKDGIISPVLFIPIAEETGLINEIGEWVMNEACRQGKIWLDKGYRLTLAVNVSPVQIVHQDIPDIVTKALNRHEYKAEHLEIEITESALMQREEEVVLMLHKLRAMGIRLAIDDFGTGYSSLSYLKRFPIDVLKIDKSFVDDLPFESDDMAITTAIIEMGKALGFQVLAEGTERIEQIEFLQEKGCTLYQGYYKSKPLPAAEFEALLISNQD